MLTSEKLNEYEQYHGFYDGFYFQKVKNKTNITSDDEWLLISSLIQDIKLTKKGLTSIEFTENLNKILMKHCSDEEALQKLKDLADEEW